MLFGFRGLAVRYEMGKKRTLNEFSCLGLLVQRSGFCAAFALLGLFPTAA
jgi:hypothetical protein